MGGPGSPDRAPKRLERGAAGSGRSLTFVRRFGAFGVEMGGGYLFGVFVVVLKAGESIVGLFGKRLAPRGGDIERAGGPQFIDGNQVAAILSRLLRKFLDWDAGNLGD